MSFAGLWERWKWPDGSPLLSFTILTTEAAPWVKFVHDRMPVILGEEAQDVWLDPDSSVDALKEVLVPRSEPMLLHPVSTIVNKAANEVPECVQPVGPTLTPPAPELTLDL